MTSPSLAPSTEILLREAEEMFNLGEEERALEIYLEILELEPRNYEALWNISLLYTRKGHRQPTVSVGNIYYQIGREYGIRALRHHSDKPRSHYVYGIATASLADKMSNSSERMELVRETIQHADRAAELDPDYAPVWHLLGVWHSKVAQVTGTKRFAARILYGRLPDDASKDKAEEYLMRASEMEPGIILFHLDLAQHYQEYGEDDRAVPILEKVMDMQPVSKNDSLYFQDAWEQLNMLRD